MAKILLVEDSKFLRLATERSLTRAGHKVITACDGEQALSLAQEKSPDLIVLDMLLPKKTGPEVLKKLRQSAETATTPIVVFTSLSQINATRLQADGATAFLEKSVTPDKGPEELMTALQEIIRNLLPRAKPAASGRP
jgi:CheY-like chemotaxis protein